MVSLRLFLRYLRTRRIAWVASLCIAMAVCAMVVVTAVMAGFRERIYLQVRGTEPDLAFRHKGRVPSQHFAAVAAALRGEMADAGGPIAALSPRLATVGLIASRVSLGAGEASEWRMLGVHVIGIDYDREREVIPLDRVLAAVEAPLRPVVSAGENPLRGPSAVPGLLTGRALARDLGLVTRRGLLVGVTDEATVLTGRLVLDARGQMAFEPSNLNFRMAGAFDTGRDDYDLSHVFMDREAYRRLRYGPDSDRPDAVQVHARLTDEARQDADHWRQVLADSHPELEVRTWKDGNRTLIDALEIENRTMSVVLAFIVLLAVCLVLGLLYMMVVEKTRDIGILRSMGLSRSAIVGTFLGYGLALGIIGAGVGIAAGLLLAADLNAVTTWLYEHFGFEVFSRKVDYRFRDIPTVLDAGRVVAIGGLTVVLTLAAGGVAALKAASLDPVVCLRYE